jgi:hypothetical protein
MLKALFLKTGNILPLPLNLDETKINLKKLCLIKSLAR